MSNITKISVYLVVIWCLILSSYLPIRAEEQPSLKIGFLLSLSGGLEQWCGYIKNGIELAVEEINEESGKADFNKEKRIRITPVFEDDHSLDRKIAVTAARKLLDIDKIDILTSWTASTVPILAPLAQSEKIPFVVGAYDHNVAEAGRNIFGGIVNYLQLPREIAKFLYTKRSARRFGLIMAADDWSQSFERPFREELKELGAELVLSETVSVSETDTSSLILRLKSKRVDAVLAPLYGNSLYAFLKQAKQMHFSGAIHVGDGMFEEDLAVAGNSAEGVFASQIWIEDPNMKEAFKKKFGVEINPLQLGLAATSYDLVKHMQGAAKAILKRGEAVGRESLAEELGIFKSQGFLGEMMLGEAPKSTGEIMVVVRGAKYDRVE